MSKPEASWKEVHERARSEGRDSYIDPATNRLVFTEIYHLKRGVCCGSGCRHCPYNHVNVPSRGSK